MESANSAEREELLANIEEGVSLKGIIKNLTDYGAFVDLGGVDGLLHITCLLYTSPSPRDGLLSRMPSSA